MNYVVEYSQSQKAYHVSTKEERLENETTHFEKYGKKSDFDIIGVFDSYEKANEFVKERKYAVKV